MISWILDLFLTIILKMIFTNKWIILRVIAIEKTCERIWFIKLIFQAILKDKNLKLITGLDINKAAQSMDVPSNLVKGLGFDCLFRKYITTNIKKHITEDIYKKEWGEYWRYFEYFKNLRKMFIWINFLRILMKYFDESWHILLAMIGKKKKIHETIDKVMQLFWHISLRYLIVCIIVHLSLGWIGMVLIKNH